MRLVRSCEISVLILASLLLSAVAECAGLNSALLSVEKSNAHATPVVHSVRRDNVNSESFTAGKDETLELLLTDGSSVTLAANSRVQVDRYRYDAATRLGELTLTVENGSARVIGGALNNTTAIRINVSGGQISMDNGVGIVRTDNGGASVDFALGKSLAITSSAGKHALIRPGQGIEVGADGTLSLPQTVTAKEAKSTLLAFNPGLATGVIPVFQLEGSSADGTETGIEVTSSDDPQAYKEALHQLPEPALAGNSTGVTCANCGALPGFGIQGNGIGSVDASGSVATTSAAAWVWTNSAGSGSSVGYDQSALTQLLKSPSGLPNAPQQVGSLFMVLGTRSTYNGISPPDCSGTCLDFSTTLWLATKVAGSQPSTPWNFDPNSLFSPIPIITSNSSSSSSGGGNIVANYTFDVSEGSSGLTLTSVTDGRLQNIAAVAAPPPSSDCSANATGCTFHLLQAGVRRSTITWTEVATDDGTGNFLVTSDNFTSPDPRAVSSVCGSATSAACVAAFINRGYTNCSGIGGGTCTPSTGGNTVSQSVQGSFVYTLPDYFFLVQGSQASPNTGQFLYATGAVSGRATSNPPSSGCGNAAACVDYFFVSSGLQGYSQAGPLTPGVAGGTRAFMPDAALTSGAYSGSIYDAGLAVINPAYSGGTAPSSRLINTEFGRDTATDTSTIAVTLGTLTYGATVPGVPGIATTGVTGGATVSAFSIGSTRATASAGSVRFDSSLESSAIGGSNPTLPVGRVGYIELSNYDPANALLTGGSAQSVGAAASATQQYVLTRLATATGTAVYGAANSSTTAGYVAGIVENNANGHLAIVQNNNAFVLASNVSQGTMNGGVGLAVNHDGSIETASLAIGTPATGTDLGSAYLDSSHFAAFAGTGSAPTAAIISAAQASPTLPVIPGASGQSTPPNFMQWGFFFGDFASTPAAGGAANDWHAHLVPWVSGVAEHGPLPTGTATYSGIVVADVSYQKQLYVTNGTYTNQWNFGTRTGSGSITMDSAVFGAASMPIRTQASSSGSGYTGNILAPTTNPAATPSSATPIGSLSGTFVKGTQGTCTSYCGAMGEFSLQTTAAHGAYTATGIFAATRH